MVVLAAIIRRKSNVELLCQNEIEQQIEEEGLNYGSLTLASVVLPNGSPTQVASLDLQCTAPSKYLRVVVKKQLKKLKRKLKNTILQVIQYTNDLPTSKSDLLFSGFLWTLCTLKLASTVGARWRKVALV